MGMRHPGSTKTKLVIPHLSPALLLVSLILTPSIARAQQTELQGHLIDPKGHPIAAAHVQLTDHDRTAALAASASDGRFDLKPDSSGDFTLRIDAPDFFPITRPVTLRVSVNAEIEITMTPRLAQTESITVTAGADNSSVLSPDPAERVFVHQDLLDANPGRPGAPVSIPGYPIETASSGIKPPQYFAPGVAGDHGEPIAQFISVGAYLVPNNLSANAHGNGYADPNILIPEVIESVQVDGGAFSVREGNHAVDLAATYGLRSRLEPFLTRFGDYRDIDAVLGLSPTRDSWLALNASYGNGFLDRLEHRQQYKLNGERVFHLNQHDLSLLAIAYYGESYIPGLVPLFPSNAGDEGYQNYGDTIDPRQRDQTHTVLIGANDAWRIAPNQQFQFSGFFRTYNLSLYSNFGQGLIRQSEFRTVTGADALYVNRLTESLSLLAGLDYEREAPRRDNLDHYGFFDPANPHYYGPFTPIDSNNVTISPIAPYGAVEGGLTHFIRYYLGWRSEEIDFNNQDLLHPENSFQKWVGVNSPKATVYLVPKDSWPLPVVAFSYGQAYFTNDPRIGTGSTPGTPISTAHSYQLVASQAIHRTDFRLTLGQVTTSQSLAKLDPDTGLQENEGPGRNRFLSVAVGQHFSQGSLLVTFSKADAR